jgi:hypothetical protein
MKTGARIKHVRPWNDQAGTRVKAILGLALAIRLGRGALSAIVALWFVFTAGEALIAAALIITGVCPRLSAPP